jgi:hypothetical protein
LRSLARQLAPQDWSALVLPGKTPQHSEFSIFHAQLGKPPVFDLNEVPRNTP